MCWNWTFYFKFHDIFYSAPGINLTFSKYKNTTKAIFKFFCHLHTFINRKKYNLDNFRAKNLKIAFRVPNNSAHTHSHKQTNKQKRTNIY